MAKNLLTTYHAANKSKRVDIILKYYPDFIGIVDGYVEGLKYKIQSEKDIKRREQMGDLGVRVQGGGIKSDPTANKAINNIITREAIINCDFSEDILEGIDSPMQYIEEAYLLRQMRLDYELVTSQFAIIGRDGKLYQKYLNGEFTMMEMASEWKISFEASKQKLYRLKGEIKNQALTFMSRELGGIA